MIACGLSMGIGKRELLEDYYWNELGAVFEEWSALHGASDDEEEHVSAEAFLGGDGERL